MRRAARPLARRSAASFFARDGSRDEFAQCKCQPCILARSIHVGYWQDKADRKAHYERAEAAHWLRVARDQPQYADEVPF